MIDNEIDYSLWNFKDIVQEFTSEHTSINSNKMPKTIKLIEPVLVKGQKWADIGGGKFNNIKEHLSTFGVELFIYDPFNRSQEHNNQVVEHIANSQCDGVMVNNVLNVILESDNRKQVIEQAFNCLKPGGVAYFKIYEGNRSGICQTSTNKASSAQLNQPTYFYVEEIQSVFGSEFKLSKEFIIVKKPLELNLSENLNDNIINDLIKTSTQYDIPGRYKKTGVGKYIGGSLYVHKNYINVFDSSYNTALQALKKNAPEFTFDIVKYNVEKNTYSFISSPDFDTKDEPTVGDSILVDSQGNLKLTKQKKDPQIYHHKWNFVNNDYQGFNVAQSIQRSITWKSVIGKNKSISSKIGTSSFWEKTLQDFGIINTTKLKIT